MVKNKLIVTVLVVTQIVFLLLMCLFSFPSPFEWGLVKPNYEILSLIVAVVTIFGLFLKVNKQVKVYFIIAAIIVVPVTALILMFNDLEPRVRYQDSYCIVCAHADLPDGDSYQILVYKKRWIFKRLVLNESVNTPNCGIGIVKAVHEHFFSEIQLECGEPSTFKVEPLKND
jgi:hypothetical protein